MSDDRAGSDHGAYDGERLVGYVNVATDGSGHAFLLDPTVHVGADGAAAARAFAVACAGAESAPR